MKLSSLFNGQPEIEIGGISIDSRKTKPGDLFFCIEGVETDGHKFVKAACEAGAVAVVHSKPLEKIEGVTFIQSENLIYDLNRVCSAFNGFPSEKMTVFGVTGTNGKTTITSIIRDIYSHFKPCGYMGTVAIRFGNVSRIPNLTTPDPVELYGNLKDMVDYGMKAVAMEVSSHGLSMGRVDAVDFDYAIFTNLTHDHLDYHKTMEKYFEAKKLLFKHMKKDGVAILNADDNSFNDLKEACSCRFVSYGIENDADYKAENLVLMPSKTVFDLVYKGKTYNITTNVAAKYNISNLLGAIAAIHEDGIDILDIIPYLSSVAQVDGRMERISEGQDFNVIVDYAHTPDGHEKIYQYAKSITDPEGKVFVVFGCPGKRDKTKRKIMGEIANKYCDKIFVTEQDPRDEEAEQIAHQIMEGIDEGKGQFISDRKEAIKIAINSASPNDTVLILGKGDESYMYYEEGRRPWQGDNNVAHEVLKKMKLQIRLMGGVELQYRENIVGINNSLGKSKKMWLLLEYLLLNMDRNVPQSELISILWPTGKVTNPTNSLKVLAFKLRQELGRLDYIPGKDLVQSANGTYMFNANIPYELDISEFEILMNRLKDTEMPREKRLFTLRKALLCFRGSVIATSNTDAWAASITTHYNEIYKSALSQAVEMLSEDENHDEIIELCKNAIRLQPFDENAYYHIIKAYAALENYSAASEMYKQVKKLMQKEYGKTPDLKFEGAYKEIMKSRPKKNMTVGELTEILEEKANYVGSFYVEYGEFKQIYRYVARTLERLEGKAFVGLYTLGARAGAELTQNEISANMEVLSDALKFSLRQGDVFTRVAPNQFAVLFTDIFEENITAISERITLYFKKNKKSKDFGIINTYNVVRPSEFEKRRKSSKL